MFRMFSPAQLLPSNLMGIENRYLKVGVDFLALNLTFNTALMYSTGTLSFCNFLNLTLSDLFFLTLIFQKMDEQENNALRLR